MNYNFSLEFMMMTKLIMCFDGKKKSQRISEIIIIIINYNKGQNNKKSRVKVQLSVKKSVTLL